MTSFFDKIAEFFEKVSAFFMTILVALGLATPEKEETPKYAETAVMSITAMENIRQIEGGCTDGRYVYEVIIDPPPQDDLYKEDVASKIIKIDTQTWSIVKVSDETVELNHGNDMTYNAADGTLMVCNNIPNFTRISVIDIDTLEIKETFEVSRPLYAIVYVGDVEGRCYYCGISNTYDIVEYDKDFNELGTISLTNNGYTRQSIDTDGEYLYFPYSYKNTETGVRSNYIYKYSFTGEQLGVLKLADTTDELENVFFLSDGMYITYNILGVGNGGTICKVENYTFI